MTAADVERMLTQSRQLLEALRAGGGAVDAADLAAAVPEDAELEAPPEVAGAVGEAAEGRVLAYATGDGLLEHLEFDPRMLRLGTEELAGYLVEAVNNALLQVRDNLTATAAAAATSIDVAALTAQVQEVQDLSIAQMATIRQSLDDVLTRIRNSTQ